MSNKFLYDNKEYEVLSNNTPFHNDYLMMRIMNELLNKTEFFVETGTCLGFTCYYVAKNFPNVNVFTCELSEYYYNESINNIGDLSLLPNLTIKLEKSPDALYNLENYYSKDIYNKPVVFWIDAHGGKDLPLYQEIDFITKKFTNYCIFIDDFQNEYDSGFSNDGELFNIKYVKNYINNKENVKVYFPNYPYNHSESSNINNIGNFACGYCVITTQEINTFGYLKEYII